MKFIYALTDLDGTIRYIGKTEQGMKRPHQHWSSNNLKKNAHLPVVRWIQKLLNENKIPNVQILEYCNSREELIDKEIQLIAKYPNLLNVTSGGEGFHSKHRDESKRKIGAYWKNRKRSEENRLKLSSSKLGVPLTEEHKSALKGPRPQSRGKIISPETRAKISTSNKGKVISREQLIKISRSKGCKPIMDEMGNKYELISDAAKALNLDQRSIRMVLDGKFRHTKGHMFRWISND